MKSLYEISNGVGDEHHYVRAYAWADSEDEARALAQSGSKFDMHAELWIVKKFDADSESFCTVPTRESAWLGPGTDRPPHRPVV